MNKKIVVGVIIVIALAVGTVFYFMKIAALGDTRYQAVFLQSGQVYFGKLSNEDGLYPTLRDVFYIQVTQPSPSAKKGEVPPSNMNLVKLGSELHGPTDEMKINRNQILFIEDLRADSRVVQSILQYKKSNP